MLRAALLATSVLLLGPALAQAAATNWFRAVNGMWVIPESETNFYIPWNGEPGPQAFFCAAGDYVISQLRLRRTRASSACRRRRGRRARDLVHPQPRRRGRQHGDYGHRHQRPRQQPVGLGQQEFLFYLLHASLTPMRPAMRPLPSLILATSLAFASPASAFIAINGLPVQPTGGESFYVPLISLTSDQAFWCAAGDFVKRGLGLPGERRSIGCRRRRGRPARASNSR